MSRKQAGTLASMPTRILVRGSYQVFYAWWVHIRRFEYSSYEESTVSVRASATMVSDKYPVLECQDGL